MVAPFVEAASETGYRLCRAPRTAAAAADEEGQHETRLARALPDGSARIALANAGGGLRLVATERQDVLDRFQVYLGSFAAGEEEEEEGVVLGLGGSSSTRPRPQPCRLPFMGLVFVPSTAEDGAEDTVGQGLFLLLGETDTVMHTTLPPALPEGDDDEAAPLPATAVNASASRRYAYGSPLLALPAHKARVTALAVDGTASVLASADAGGLLRVWKLQGSGGTEDRFGGAGAVADVEAAHQGPILALAHGEALAGEEGHIVTGGRDRAVRVWAWRLDEWGRLGVRPLHTLLTERCEVRCLGAGQGLGLVVAGSDRGALYCWSSLTAVLEYVAVGDGAQALTCVAALAAEEEEGGGVMGEEASLVVTADAAGTVRLYRPTYMDPAKAPAAGEEGEEQEEEEEDSAWQPVAEAQLDGSAVAAMAVRGRLVVVSSTGLVMPWPFHSLPRFPGEERRPPPPPAKQAPPSLSSESEEAEEEEEAGEERPRRIPPPAPTATAPVAAGEEEAAAAVAEAYLAGLRGAWEKGEWAACELGAPAVNSTAAVRRALAEARAAEFDAAAAWDEAETASVRAEAARAVNVDPGYRAYRGLRDVADVRLPTPRVVKRQPDPAWAAKQALRPTATDFFTPGLEGLVLGSGVGSVDAGTVPLWPAGRAVAPPQEETEDGEGRRIMDPYLALYGDAV